MLTTDKAREIARRYANPADADWNKIAAFVRDGSVLPGFAQALLEVRSQEPNLGGEVVSGNSRDLLELIQFAKRAEATSVAVERNEDK